jgi:hypothetical protein
MAAPCLAFQAPASAPSPASSRASFWPKLSYLLLVPSLRALNSSLATISHGRFAALPCSACVPQRSPMVARPSPWHFPKPRFSPLLSHGHRWAPCRQPRASLLAGASPFSGAFLLVHPQLRRRCSLAAGRLLLPIRLSHNLAGLVPARLLQRACPQLDSSLQPWTCWSPPCVQFFFRAAAPDLRSFGLVVDLTCYRCRGLRTSCSTKAQSDGHACAIRVDSDSPLTRNRHVCVHDLESQQPPYSLSSIQAASPMCLSISTIYLPVAHHLHWAPKPLSCSTLEASNLSTSLASSKNPESLDKATNPVWCSPRARRNGKIRNRSCARGLQDGLNYWWAVVALVFHFNISRQFDILALLMWAGDVRVNRSSELVQE